MIFSKSNDWPRYAIDSVLFGEECGGRRTLGRRGRRVWEREVHLFKTLAWHAGKVKVNTLMIALSDNLVNCLSSGELVYKMTKVKMSCLQLICMMLKSIWSSATVLWLMWSGQDTETFNLAIFEEIFVFWEGEGIAQYSHIKHKSVFTPTLCRQCKQFIGSCYLHH